MLISPRLRQPPYTTCHEIGARVRVRVDWGRAGESINPNKAFSSLCSNLKQMVYFGTQPSTCRRASYDVHPPASGLSPSHWGNINIDHGGNCRLLSLLLLLSVATSPTDISISQNNCILNSTNRWPQYVHNTTSALETHGSAATSILLRCTWYSSIGVDTLTTLS